MPLVSSLQSDLAFPTYDALNIMYLTEKSHIETATKRVGKRIFQNEKISLLVRSRRMYA